MKLKAQGLHANRLSMPTAELERSFAKCWDEINPQQLQYLIGDDPSKKEREVAATVIQWLGSTVGFDFVQEAIRRGGYKMTITRARPQV